MAPGVVLGDVLRSAVTSAALSCDFSGFFLRLGLVRQSDRISRILRVGRTAGIGVVLGMARESGEGECLMKLITGSGKRLGLAVDSGG